MNPNESLQTFCIANEMAQQLLDTRTHTRTHHTEIGSILVSSTIYLLVFLIFWLALFELWPQQRAYFEGESTRESICIVVVIVVVHSSAIESLKSLIGIGSIEEIHMYA